MRVYCTAHHTINYYMHFLHTPNVFSRISTAEMYNVDSLQKITLRVP